MGMYGIVYKINGDEAFVLTSDTEFAKIKVSSELSVGQQVEFDRTDVIMPGTVTDNPSLSAKNVIRKLSFVTGIAAAIIIVFLVSQFGILKRNGVRDDFAYIDIDTNSSFGMVINKSGKVIEVKAINKNAEEILSRVKLEGSELKNAIELVAMKSNDTGFNGKLKNNTVLVSCSLNNANKEYVQNKKEMELRLNEILKSAKEGFMNSTGDLGNLVIKDMIVTPEIRNLALKNKMSMGRYALYARARENGADLTLEKAKNIPINEVLDKTGTGNIEVSEISVGSTPTPVPYFSAKPSQNNSVTATPVKGKSSATPPVLIVTSGVPTKETIPSPVILPSHGQNNLSIKGLIAWYKFDESGGTDVMDSSGNGHNAVLHDNASFTPCRTGNALKLTGQGGYVKLPDGILGSVKDVSITAWVKINTEDKFLKIFDFGKWSSSYMYLTPRNNGTNCLRFGISNNGFLNENGVDGCSSLPAGVWKHVAVTISGKVGVIYLNGIENGRNSNLDVDMALLANSFNNFIGNSRGDNNNATTGQFDDFRIYDRALSQSEIKSIFNEGNPGGTPKPVNAFDRIDAENFDSRYGSVRNETANADGDYIGLIQNGDYIVFNDVDFGSGADKFEIRASSAGHGGKVEVIMDNVKSPPAGVATITNTGSWESWKTTTCSIDRINGRHKLILKFTGDGGILYKINWFKFY